jgi:hypothetical protein
MQVLDVCFYVGSDLEEGSISFSREGQGTHEIDWRIDREGDVAFDLEELHWLSVDEDDRFLLVEAVEDARAEELACKDTEEDTEEEAQAVWI